MNENEEKEVIENLASELEKIDNKIKEDLHKNLKSLDSCLPNIAKKINELYIKRKERLIATKGRFNLFTTLLAIGDETRLHSRFITHLLNPKGNHDCDNLFLNLFIDTISESNLFPDKEIKNIFEDIKIQNCELVRTEKPADGRRIDIYLHFNKSVIAIENKIWASEQPNQIFDYGDFIDSNEKKNFLFYLTLDGKDSETAEITDENSKKSNVEYFPISYKEHILKWLEKCLQATYKYVNINQAIQQYKNVIKQLTNQTMENEEMKEINELIKAHPLIIKYQNEINNSINETWNKYRNEFWKKLLDEITIFNISISSKKDISKWQGNFYESYEVTYQNAIFRIEHDITKNNFYIGLINIPNNPSPKERWPYDVVFIYKNDFFDYEFLLDIMKAEGMEEKVEENFRK